MAITVADLIAELSAYPDDMEVRISYNYGDHWNTQVAPEITTVEQVCVEPSDYHSMDVVVDTEDDEETGEPLQAVGKMVLILR